MGINLFFFFFNSQVKGLCSMIKKRKVAALENREGKFPSSANSLTAVACEDPADILR